MVFVLLLISAAGVVLILASIGAARHLKPVRAGAALALAPLALVLVWNSLAFLREVLLMTVCVMIVLAVLYVVKKLI